MIMIMIMHKICVNKTNQTQLDFFSQSESCIKDLRLIFLICVQTQFLCNGARINTILEVFTLNVCLFLFNCDRAKERSHQRPSNRRETKTLQH